MKVPKFIKHESKRNSFDVRKSQQLISAIKFEHDSSMVNIESINFVTPLKPACMEKSSYDKKLQNSANLGANNVNWSATTKSSTNKPNNLDIIYNVTQSTIKAKISPSIVKSIKSGGSGRFTKSAQTKRLQRSMLTPFKLNDKNYSETPVRSYLKVKKSIVTEEKTATMDNENLWTPISTSRSALNELRKSASNLFKQIDAKDEKTPAKLFKQSFSHLSKLVSKSRLSAKSASCSSTDSSSSSPESSGEEKDCEMYSESARKRISRRSLIGCEKQIARRDSLSQLSKQSRTISKTGLTTTTRARRVPTMGITARMLQNYREANNGSSLACTGWPNAYLVGLPIVFSGNYGSEEVSVPARMRTRSMKRNFDSSDDELKLEYNVNRNQIKLQIFSENSDALL